MVKRSPAPGCPERLLECPGCALVYVSPRRPDEQILRVYSDPEASRDYLERLYLPHEEGRHTVFAGLLSEVAELAPARGLLLDVGAATGALLHQARQQGWNPAGLEPSHPAREYARHHYGLTLNPGFLGEQPLPEADCVTMLDVLEHLPAPRRALEAVAGALRPGGLLAILTPNWDSLARRLLGSAWDAIVPDGHLQYFRAPVLGRLLERSGLRVLRAGTRGLRPLNRRPRLRRLGEAFGWGEALWFIARREATP